MHLVDLWLIIKLYIMNNLNIFLGATVADAATRPLHWVYDPKKLKSYIKDKFFLMLLPDDLIIKKNCSKAMISIHNRKKDCSVIASMKVPKKTVNRWGIFLKEKNLDEENFYIKDVIEKPEIDKAPSNNAVIGRYILPKQIFRNLKYQKKGKGGEIHITDTIKQLIIDGHKFIGHNFKGKYLDCGTMHGYIKSSKEISRI